jgi:hypothetical protein
LISAICDHSQIVSRRWLSSSFYIFWQFVIVAALMMVAVAAAMPQSYPSEANAKPSYDDVRYILQLKN